MQELQDEVIIQLVLQGDVQAYAVLVDRYKHFVFTLVSKINTRHEDAEEVTQDVFVKAYQSLSKYDGRSKFSTWLYTIARNTAISHHRKKDLLPHEETKQIHHTDKSTEHLLKHRDKQTTINNAINLLNPDEQTIITLFYIQEQTIEEIAQILEITQSNVKVKLYRARKHLKAIMDKHYKGEFTEYGNTKN